MRFGIAGIPTLLSSNRVFHKFLWVHALKERLINGYFGVAIGESMKDPSSEHFSVTEELETTENCWMGAPESRCKTVAANLQIWFDSVEIGEVLH